MANRFSIISGLILVLFFQVRLFAQSEKITIEAVSDDPTLVVRGKEWPVDLIDGTFLPGKVVLLTTSPIDKPLTGILVDADFKVIKKIDKSLFDNRLLKDGRFIVVVLTKSNARAENFFNAQIKEGDIIKLRKNGKICSLSEISLLGQASFELELDEYITVSNSNLSIKGNIKNYSSDKQYQIVLSSEMLLVEKDFVIQQKLKPGVNYIDMELRENNKKVFGKSIKAFLKTSTGGRERKVLWIEQFPNAKRLTNDLAIDSVLTNAKLAGFNCVALDVKGPEGYASYRKNNLSGTPYFTSTTNPNKKVAENGFDLLQAMIKGARRHDLKIYASFNFFSEGNLTTQDFAVLRQHPEWEEIVQRPEDKGALLKVSESAVGLEAKQGKRIALAFVNPSNKDVVDFQILRLKEVLQNYDVDGVVLDRTRYDNLYADFSDVSRIAFEEYLSHINRKLEKFPEDAFLIDKKGALVEGRHFVEWITFRSGVIHNFAKQVRVVVDDFNRAKNKKVELSAYVGSWYEVYYQNGVNWASPNFSYDHRLGFPETKIYTIDYTKTSYTDFLDFLMIGTYFKTDKEIKKYVTLGNILTNGELPLIASLSLPDLSKDLRPAIFKSATETSAGIMIFDLCYIQWNDFLEQMKSIKK